MARPVPADTPPVRVRFGEFELDEANASLLRGGQPVAVAPTPFNLLCALARKPGSLLSKDALLQSVWGHEFVSDSVLKTAVSDLRMALGDDPREPRLIETVARRGYRFIARPSELPHAQPPVEPAPEMPLPAPSSGFIGRSEAIARLHRAWNGAAAGKRTLVWVAGEPGIGKTTLIEQFVQRLGGAACARGQCVEHYGAGEPYLPVLDALGDLARRNSEVPALLRAVAPTWLLQLPWLSTPEEREALRRELAGVGPDRMLREMGELLDRATERRPLLVITEDLHWGDRATIQLLDYLARRRGPARLMWLASFRLSEVVAGNHPLNAVRHELRMHRLAEEIVLDPFSEREVAEYVARTSALLADDELFVHRLHERTDGVPLFVASILEDVLADAAPQAAGAPAHEQLEAVGIPENLAAIIDQYLLRLAEEDRALLAAGAVCGFEFRAETVAGVIAREPEVVARTCERLSRAELWLAAPPRDDEAPERPYAFRHALFRQVLYERTAPALRAELHRKAGAALERERAAGRAVPAAELAMHFDRGRDAMTALRYYAEAAEASLRLLSPEESLESVARGFALLEQAPAGAERNALAIALWTLRGVSLLHLRGVGNEAKDAYRQAYALLAEAPQHPLRGLLLDGLGFLLCQRAEYDEALALAERTAALWSLTEDPVLLVTACYVQGDVYLLKGRPRVARAWIERALPALAPASNAADSGFVAMPQVMLLGLLAIQLFHLGLHGQARERLHEANECARQLASPVARVLADWMDAMLAIRLGDVERVAALAQEMEALVEEAGFAQGRPAAQWYQGWAEAHEGRPREGFERIRAAFEANTALGMVSGGSEILGYAAEALVLAGDWDGAQEQLAQALRIAQTCGERVYLPQLHLLEAAIARGRGQQPEAEAAVRRALAEARAQDAPWHELLALLALCEHGGASEAERQALAALVAQMPEASGAAAVTRAQALLASPRAD